MKKFYPPHFYTIVEDKEMTPVQGGHLRTIIPTPAGLAFLITHLNIKYQANISYSHPQGYDFTVKTVFLFSDEKKEFSHPYGEIFSTPFEQNLEQVDVFAPRPIYINFCTREGLNQIALMLADLPKELTHYRKAFIVNSDVFHAALLVYLRENGQERLLYTDSLGVSKIEAKQIGQVTGIKTFFNASGRQFDSGSCYLDALAHARDLTAKEADNHYRIENIIAKLEARSSQINEFCSEVIFPNSLLKTAQRPGYLGKNIDLREIRETIHKGENLVDFRERYSLLVRGESDSSPKKFSVYLNQKAEKYAAMIAIQFYLKEIELDLGRTLGLETRCEFIKKSKPLKNLDQLFEFALNFLLSQFSQEEKENDIQNQSGPSNPAHSVYYLQKQKKLEYFTGLERVLQTPQTLAQKYNLELKPWLSYINSVKLQLQGIPFETSWARTKPSFFESVILALFDTDSKGLALCEYLLEYYTPYFNAEFWYNLSLKGDSFRALILSSKLLIQRLTERNELFYFGYRDPKLIRLLLEKYRCLLEEKEILAFESIIKPQAPMQRAIPPDKEPFPLLQTFSYRDRLGANPTPDDLRKQVKNSKEFFEMIQFATIFYGPNYDITDLIEGFTNQELKIFILEVALQGVVSVKNNVLRHNLGLFFQVFDQLSPSRKISFVESFDMNDLMLMLVNEPQEPQAKFLTDCISMEKRPELIKMLIYFYQDHGLENAWFIEEDTVLAATSRPNGQQFTLFLSDAHFKPEEGILEKKICNIL